MNCFGTIRTLARFWVMGIFAMGIIAARVDAQVGSFSSLDYPDAVFTDARAINTAGQIVGRYILSGVSHGYLFAGGTFATIDFPGASGTNANWINDSGQIVGTYNLAGLDHGYLLSGGAFSTIDFPGATHTDLLGINNDGTKFVGNYTAAGVEHGFLLSGGTFTTIDFPGTEANTARAVNNSGRIVGYSAVTLGGIGHGFLYSGGTFATIDFPGSNNNQAQGINDDGQIVGDYYDSNGAYHGFLFSAGNFTSFDFPSADDTAGFGITDSGQIAGYYQMGGTIHGFVASVAAPSLYNICLLYNPTKAVKSGATLPIKLQLCDASGTNLSSPNIFLQATSVSLASSTISGTVQDAGNANPDNGFRYDSTLGGTGGYIFNLSTKGLTTGTYNLTFQAGSDPVMHEAQFQVK
ncbi:MAG TPA: PxKF domain-containing protein [Pyrinomonadaceae bacterium]|nr:PxKF domain-containing protein [Pyrinomonadaceae bacterium]